MRTSDDPTPADLRQATRDWSHMARAEAGARRAQAQQTRTRAEALIAEARQVQATPPGQASPQLDADGLEPREAVRLTGISPGELWMDYAALGGDRDPDQIAAYLSGRSTLPDLELHILKQALSEYQMDR